MSIYPQVKDEKLVGTYPGFVNSGGGYVWDDVLEYRVWCFPLNGAPDIEDGDGGDFYYFFDKYDEALKYSEENIRCEKPLALVLQEEYISGAEPSGYIHVKEQRLTEWPVEFLSRPRRTFDTIPNFFSANAPSNKLDILRGLA